MKKTDVKKTERSKEFLAEEWLEKGRAMGHARCAELLKNIEACFSQESKF